MERSDKHCGDASRILHPCLSQTKNLKMHFASWCLQSAWENSWKQFNKFDCLQFWAFHPPKCLECKFDGAKYVPWLSPLLSRLSLLQVGKWVGGGRGIVGVLVGASKGSKGASSPNQPSASSPVCHRSGQGLTCRNGPTLLALLQVIILSYGPSFQGSNNEVP